MNWPLYRDSRADVSSVSPSSERIEELYLDQSLRWLETVSTTYIFTGHYNHSLSFDATTIVSKKCPTIGEHVVITFVTQQATIATVFILAKNTLNYSFRSL